MSELGNLFDSFYNRFVLRDLLGKITPGAFVLFTLGVVLRQDGWQVFYEFTQLGFSSLILWGAVAWLIGFVLQMMAELIGRLIMTWFVRIFPRDVSPQEFLVSYGEFIVNSSEELRRYVERIGVLKEASGNTLVSLTLCVMILIANFLWDVLKESTLTGFLLPFSSTSLSDWHYVLLLLFLIAVGFFLSVMNRNMAEREFFVIHQARQASWWR